MSRVRIKICGIKTLEVAWAAAAAGADAVGLVFAPSHRRVTPDEARAVVRGLPPFVTAVGVFVDAQPGEIEELARSIPLSTVQLHGDESPEDVRRLRDRGLQVIKAVRVDGGADVEADLFDRFDAAAAILLDSRVDGAAGGTGRTFLWERALQIATRGPVIVSGGLDASNVGRALEMLRPYGVDVSSGVETDGQKDPGKIREFIGAVRRWERGR